MELWLRPLLTRCPPGLEAGPSAAGESLPANLVRRPGSGAVCVFAGVFSPRRRLRGLWTRLVCGLSSLAGRFGLLRDSRWLRSASRSQGSGHVPVSPLEDCLREDHFAAGILLSSLVLSSLRSKLLPSSILPSNLLPSDSVLPAAWRAGSRGRPIARL